MQSEIAASIPATAYLRGIDDLADLAALAADAGPFISESELHGAVCGLVAGGADSLKNGGDSLLQELIDLLGSDALADADSIDAFVQASSEALLAEDLGFQPLLPGDEAAVADRVQAVAEWCGAFAAGYGAAGGASDDEQSEELLRDFIAISGVGMEDEDEDTAEESLLELEQYAKVGALLLVTEAQRRVHDGA